MGRSVIPALIHMMLFRRSPPWLSISPSCCPLYTEYGNTNPYLPQLYLCMTVEVIISCLLLAGIWLALVTSSLFFVVLCLAILSRMRKKTLCLNFMQAFYWSLWLKEMVVSSTIRTMNFILCWLYFFLSFILKLKPPLSNYSLSTVITHWTRTFKFVSIWSLTFKFVSIWSLTSKSV